MARSAEPGPESSGSAGPGGVQAEARRSDRASATGRPVPLLLTAVAFLTLAWPTLRLLDSVYRRDPTCSHGYLVPLVAALALYSRRAALARLPDTLGFWSLGLVPAGTALVVLGAWYAAAFGPTGAGHLVLRGLGLILCLTGLGACLLGPVRAWHLRFAFAYLMFALPAPVGVVTAATQSLQRLSAALATGTLRLLGIAVRREGNLLLLPHVTIGVEEACSGVRSLVTLTAAAVAMIFFWRLRRGAAAIVLLLVPAAAMAGNLLRLALTGVLANLGYRSVMHEVPHYWLGMGTMAASTFAVLLVAKWLAAPVSGVSADLGVESTSDTSWAVPMSPSLLRFRQAQVLASAVVLGLGAWSAAGIARHYQKVRPVLAASQPPRQTFAELPRRLGAYRCVAETDLSAGERRQLAPSDSLDREYVDESGQRVRVRLLYWAPRWLAYGDASGPVEGPHEPDCCLSGQGWDRVPGTEEQRTVPWLPGEAVSLRVIRKGDATHAVAFWKKKQDLPPLFHLGSWRKRASLLLASWHSPPTAEVGAQYGVTLTTPLRADAASAGQRLLEFSSELAPWLRLMGVGHGPDLDHPPSDPDRERARPSPRRSGGGPPHYPPSRSQSAPA